ncbi:MFS transporter [Allorhizobium undicola]|uniref:MFS transporter n=1 Tax=Allorhizobium undicola TaxID=78527 RepID=UPI003D34D9CF
MSAGRNAVGMAALMVGHCAGMIDLVALPVWVGTLVSKYGFDPQRAGGLATLFLISGVMASAIFAPRFNRLPVRAVAATGFALAGLSFLGVSLLQAYLPIAILHVAAGLSVGAALSVTHGNIGRSASPHQLFAAAGLCLGVFGIVILGAAPPIVDQFGGAVLFRIFAATMAVGALISAMAFPDFRKGDASARAAAGPMPGSVWFGIVGVSAMALVQSTVFSFVERRIRLDHDLHAHFRLRSSVAAGSDRSVRGCDARHADGRRGPRASPWRHARHDVRLSHAGRCGHRRGSLRHLRLLPFARDGRAAGNNLRNQQ